MPVGANGCVTPRMQTRNRKVATTSNTKAATTLYSPMIAGPPAVLAEAAGPAVRLAGEDDVKHDRTGDRAEHLCDP